VLSVVLCTYNPTDKMLARSLASVSRCVSDFGSDAECVVVDNNSTPPIRERPVVASALADLPRLRVVVEERQGLSFARLRGVAETSGEVIVFFDDDNEPSATYLREADRVFREHSQVAVFGPGVVDVEFLGHVPPWIDSSCRHFFQERQSSFTEYACLRTPWHAVYPPGTGQSVRRVVMERYAARVADGACTATDRRGKSLSSGGDGQIVHTAVSMGYAAGICPELRVRHLIPESRCTVEYLSRLSYGVTAALLPAAVESFPELRGRGEYAPPSRLRYQRDKWLAAVRESMQEVAPLRRIHSAARVGDAVGRYLAAGLPVPAWLAREKQRLMVE
jgi:glycosyltransferase involved in cell wall biosynthesis